MSRTQLEKLEKCLNLSDAAGEFNSKRSWRSNSGFHACDGALPGDPQADVTIYPNVENGAMVSEDVLGEATAPLECALSEQADTTLKRTPGCLSGLFLSEKEAEEGRLDFDLADETEDVGADIHMEACALQAVLKERGTVECELAVARSEIQKMQSALQAASVEVLEKTTALEGSSSALEAARTELQEKTCALEAESNAHATLERELQGIWQVMLQKTNKLTGLLSLESGTKAKAVETQQIAALKEQWQNEKSEMERALEAALADIAEKAAALEAARDVIKEKDAALEASLAEKKVLECKLANTTAANEKKMLALESELMETQRELRAADFDLQEQSSALEAALQETRAIERELEEQPKVIENLREEIRVQNQEYQGLEEWLQEQHHNQLLERDKCILELRTEIGLQKVQLHKKDSAIRNLSMISAEKRMPPETFYLSQTTSSNTHSPKSPGKSRSTFFPNQSTSSDTDLRQVGQWSKTCPSKLQQSFSTGTIRPDMEAPAFAEKSPEKHRQSGQWRARQESPQRAPLKLPQLQPSQTGALPTLPAFSTTMINAELNA